MVYMQIIINFWKVQITESSHCLNHSILLSRDTEKHPQLGLVARKPVIGVPTKRHSNLSDQLQRQARILKFHQSQVLVCYFQINE